ncbi:MAG: hypothetical protein M3251_03545, partial [Thermoproteota archaeon]|nr:hypothetical protein [Thermoproteota archaeon]
MLTINKCYTGFNLLMPIAQSKRKLIAATALFVAVGTLTGAIATVGAASMIFAQTQQQEDGGTTGQQGGQQGGQDRIVRQGTVTSEPVTLPGFEGGQRATILPLVQEGGIYSGVLTFTATEPVDVVILNTQTLNATERAILNATEEDEGELGTLLTSQLDNETSIAISTITPTYGDAPAPSASIPFTGNAVWLHTTEGTPFVASYAVSAQVLPTETQNTISNVTLATAGEDTDAGDEDADADEGEAADEGEEGKEGEEGGAGGAGAPA